MNDVLDRYLRDPIFHTVVEHMRNMIRSATLTPSEVREAAMAACVIEEMYNPRPPLTTSGEDLERVRIAMQAQRPFYTQPAAPTPPAATTPNADQHEG